MKKIMTLAALVCIMGLVGCTIQVSKNSSENNSDYTTVPPSEIDDGLVSVCDFKVSYTNWTDDSRIYFNALNRDTFAISSIMHLPIYKFANLEELNNFKQTFAEVLTMDGRYDESPSFNEATAQYDDAFFSENSLMLVYVTANSGSLRFALNSYYCDGKSFVAHIKPTNNPEIFTEDMAGWFITIPVSDTLIANCETFDAVFGNIK